MQNRQQAEWVEDLLNRLEVEADPSVAVCILDTGVNNGHPAIHITITGLFNRRPNLGYR